MSRFYALNIYWVIPFIAALAVSCRPSVPDKYIQPDEMEDILYDYHISQALANQGNDPSVYGYNRSMYYNAVLKKYDITEAEFDSSLVYYYTHADRLFDIYKRLSERMGNEAMGLGASVGEIGKYSQLKSDGDTANVWREMTSMVLLPYPPYNRFSFSMKADSTFKRGDSFLFNFMADFMYQAGTKDAIIYMSVRYDNDSVSAHTSHVSVSGISQLRIPGNVDNAIKEIDGFIYLNRGNDGSQTLKLMFIDQIQFIRFHNKAGKADMKNNSPGTRARQERMILKKDSVPKTAADTMVQHVGLRKMERVTKTSK